MAALRQVAFPDASMNLTRELVIPALRQAFSAR
jgi:hypothetical protein